MPFSFSVEIAVGVRGKIAASPVCAISAILAELGMNSSTFLPIVSRNLLKPGSTLASVPPWMRLNIRKACRPKDEAEADWKTTLSLNLGSARSIHEVGAAQPFSSNSFLL